MHLLLGQDGQRCTEKLQPHCGVLHVTNMVLPIDVYAANTLALYTVVSIQPQGCRKVLQVRQYSKIQERPSTRSDDLFVSLDMWRTCETFELSGCYFWLSSRFHLLFLRLHRALLHNQRLHHVPARHPWLPTVQVSSKEMCDWKLVDWAKVRRSWELNHAPVVVSW